MQLVFGERYRIRRTNNEIVEGTLVQTKGNDDHYPTFEVTGLGLLGVHRDNVLGPVDDVAPNAGIPRVVQGERTEDESDEHLLNEDNLEQSLIDFVKNGDQ